MPGWKALPEELDPQVREFAEQLRWLIDRSGLGLAAIADRTGFGKTSWERYLDGRTLAPRGAVVALAEMTDTNPAHLTSLWELAERAWSRDEERRGATGHQQWLDQARDLLEADGQLGGTAGAAGATASVHVAGDPDGSGPEEGRGPGRRPSASASWNAVLGHASPMTPPPGPTPYGTPIRVNRNPDGEIPTTQLGVESLRKGPGTRPVPRVPRPAAPRDTPAASGAAAPEPAKPRPAPAPPGTPQGAEPPSGTGPGPTGDKRKIIMFLAGVVGALAVIVGAVSLTELGGSGKDEPKRPVARSSPVAPAPKPPAPKPTGVKCEGKECTGQDPEAMGCGGQFARTVSQATLGTARVEVRYSEVCEAAWARITDAAPGDTVRISVAGKGIQRGRVTTETDAYTPMTASRKGTDAKACVRVTTGAEACTVVQP
jgi:hypothetical protein